MRLKTEAKIRANVSGQWSVVSGQCLLADRGEHTPVALHTGPYENLHINTYTLQPEGPHFTQLNIHETCDCALYESKLDLHNLKE